MSSPSKPSPDTMDVDASDSKPSDSKPSDTSTPTSAAPTPSAPTSSPTDAGTDTASIPLPALEATTAEEAVKISSIIEDALSPLLAEARVAKRLRITNDQTNLYYQEKLQQLISSAPSLEAAREREQSHLERVEQLRAELEDLRSREERGVATMRSLKEENESLRKRLADRDATIASDAAELSRLRPVVAAGAALPSVEAERDSLRDALRREVERRESADEVHKAATHALHSQVATLTGEVTATRTEAAALRAAQDGVAREAERRARDMDEREAAVEEERRRMEKVVERLSKELSDTKAAAAQLDESFKTEVQHLEKMCELHEGRVKEAEARAVDCEEALKQERELSDTRTKKLQEMLNTRQTLGHVGPGGKYPAAASGDLAPHVHALLADMEKALESRWALLESQKKEVERARQVEMHAIAERERLERELKDFRAKADMARRDAIRYSEQVDQQAEEITRLEKQVLETQQSAQAQVEQMQKVFSLNTPSTPLRLSSSAGKPPRRSSLSWLPQQSAKLQHRLSLGPPNPADQPPVDIGPQSIIPIDYFASPSANVPHQASAEFSMSLREMSEIRKRHERVLESMRDNRISLG